MAFEKILLITVLPILWNVLTVFYLVQQFRKHNLTPLKFSLVFTLSYSLLISTILFAALARAYGVTVMTLGFALFLFLLHWAFFPGTCLLAKYLLSPKVPEQWSSQFEKFARRMMLIFHK